jgi:hypothetical protein
MVLADFFSIMLISYMFSKLNSFYLRIFLICIVAFLFSMWCFLDVRNYITAQRIIEYESWFKFLI